MKSSGGQERAKFRRGSHFADKVSNPDYEAVVRNSFAQQGLMQAIEAKLITVRPGEATITLAYQESLTQQHGFFHAGVVTSIVDTACGYAALTLMPPESEVLTVEYKVNFVSPAAGDQLTAYGRVVKAGRSILACEGEVFARKDGAETLCALMLTTMIRR